MFVNSVHAQTASYRKRNAPQSTVLQNPPKKVDAYHRALPSNHSVKANKCAVPKDCASRMKCDTACQNYANNIPVLSPRKKLLQNSDSKFDQQRGMQHVHHSMENCFLLSGQWHSRLSAAAVQVNEELASGPKEPAAKVCDHWLIGRSRTLGANATQLMKAWAKLAGHRQQIHALAKSVVAQKQLAVQRQFLMCILFRCHRHTLSMSPTSFFSSLVDNDRNHYWICKTDTTNKRKYSGRGSGQISAQECTK